MKVVLSVSFTEFLSPFLCFSPLTFSLSCCLSLFACCCHSLSLFLAVFLFAALSFIDLFSDHSLGGGLYFPSPQTLHFVITCPLSEQEEHTP
jgi:hypothetical protein